MVIERDKHAWRHTSSLMALIANCNSSKKKFSPREFDPYAKPAPLEKISVRNLAGLWGIKPPPRKVTNVSSN